ncbi:hypothetical protein CDL12_24308 [Handroanthus impetiginosus]|uniref:Uncharacterized protein n=1 Tax=Handroanthus impetiginosus TaxID=429701 RepID=A0A2G9GD17_9LAMI|nr:hypothetical protein CDL12_24308 [Handroanthus impetiginosus]
MAANVIAIETMRYLAVSVASIIKHITSHSKVTRNHKIEGLQQHIKKKWIKLVGQPTLPSPSRKSTVTRGTEIRTQLSPLSAFKFCNVLTLIDGKQMQSSVNKVKRARKQKYSAKL